MAVVIGVDKGSIAEEMGVEVGDELLGFNGEPIEDILDYYYYDSQEKFVINMKAKQGDIVDLEIEKDLNEQLGMSLDDSVQLNPIVCKNKCKFCFVDQLPKGLRKTLYVKDDDYRLSFVSGSFVTMTNVGQHELDRIVKLQLSPLYISVHAFTPSIKTKLIANPNGEKLFDQMHFLAAHGIRMHTQIVMCKDLNDGEELKKTLTELAKLRPSVQTIAVVPVGMTTHREGLSDLKPVDKQCAIDTIKMVEAFNKEQGGLFCWCSDELYVKAELPVPSLEYYGKLDQIENGIGLCRVFVDAAKDELASVKVCDKKATIGLITGQSFKGYLKEVTELINEKYPNVEFKIYDIINNFFGTTITVAGLITGTDIVAQVKDPPKDIVIPATMLREFTTTFLDGMTVEGLEDKLNAKIHVSQGGASLVKIVGEIVK